MLHKCINEVNVMLSSVQLFVLEALKKAKTVFSFRVVSRQVEDTVMKQRRLGLSRLLEEMPPDQELVTLVNTETRQRT